jgi:hypothetical protein
MTIPNSQNMPGSMQPKATPAEPFRFLDLPIDLRLMVYEHLAPETLQNVFEIVSRLIPTNYGETSKGIEKTTWAMQEETIEVLDPTEKSEYHIVVQRQSLSSAILRVCKLVHYEAAPILAKQLQAVLVAPIQIEGPCHHCLDAAYEEDFYFSWFSRCLLLIAQKRWRMVATHGSGARLFNVRLCELDLDDGIELEMVEEEVRLRLEHWAGQHW